MTDSTILARGVVLREALAANTQDFLRLFDSEIQAPLPDGLLPGVAGIAAARAAIVEELNALEQVAKRDGGTVGVSGVPKLADVLADYFHAERPLAAGETWIELRIRAPQGV